MLRRNPPFANVLLGFLVRALERHFAKTTTCLVLVDVSSLWKLVLGSVAKVCRFFQLLNMRDLLMTFSSFYSQASARVVLKASFSSVQLLHLLFVSIARK